jgi:hypothetical protein
MKFKNFLNSLNKIITIIILILLLNNTKINSTKNTKNFLSKKANTNLNQNKIKEKIKSEAEKKISKFELSKIFNKKISTFLIKNEINKSALLNFKIKKTPLNFILGISENKNFIIKNNNNINNKNNLEIYNDNKVTLRAKTLSINSLKLKGDFKFNKISQWKLFMQDTFLKNNTSLNWDFNKVTKCKYYNMLGGICQTSEKEISKEILNLPSHKEIRIIASYHFIGNWDSNSGYLKLDGLNFKSNDPQYVWINKCISKKDNEFGNKKNNNNDKDKKASVTSRIKLCDFDVCRMNDIVNVSLFHTGDYLKLIFGSTLKSNSCESSYAISDVKIFIR